MSTIKAQLEKNRDILFTFGIGVCIGALGGIYFVVLGVLVMAGVWYMPQILGKAKPKKEEKKHEAGG